MDFGNRLKTLRVQRKIKTFEITEKINISESTYRRYERNEIAPDLNVVSKIAHIYDLSLSDLLSEDKIIFNKHQYGRTSNNEQIMNQLSEKVIEQFEIRIKEKDEYIDRLTKIIDKFA
jgi:transcriptional regulator with XRE-family HTH domain